MLIAGASGHAIELLSILKANGYDMPVCFYDDIPGNQVGGGLGPGSMILRTPAEAGEYFKTASSFCIGVGKPSARKLLAARLQDVGGVLSSVISKLAFIGGHNVQLGEGLNIMQGVVITTNAEIGLGVLVHVHVSIHHDTIIGDFSELSPGCRILGGASIGSGVSVGTNAVVMRNIKVGDNAVIGAGAVVTKDVSAGETVVGVPARKIGRK